ncbi:Uncharacterised protein [Bordetella pertussis]|nr:Uncharacterised protein [Bordetella pertussis]
MYSLPPRSTVWPAYSLTPVSVRRPSPFLTRSPAPDIAPLQVRVASRATSKEPRTSVRSRLLEKLPPASRSPPCRVIAPRPRLSSCPARSAPASTTVPPEYVLAPARTSVPWPDLRNMPPPLSSPFQVTVCEASTSMVAWPRKVAAREVAKLPVLCSVPSFSASAPRPRLASRDICSVPALTVVPPFC